MPSYQYQAIHMQTKSRSTGVILADTERHARELLRGQELMTTTIKVVTVQRTIVKTNPIKQLIGRFRGVGAKEVIVFSKNVGMMVRNGLPLTEALMYFETYLDNAAFRAIISQIRKDITNGLGLSSALAKYPKLFNSTYVNVIRAGEVSGELDKTMARMTEMMGRSEKINKKIKSAMVYPIVILCITGLVLLLIFTIVLPTFVGIYKSMGVELPLITQIMVAISTFLTSWWFVAFPMLFGSGFGLMKWLKSPHGIRTIDVVSLKLPAVKDVTLFTNASQFISCLSVGFAAGIPITEALFLAGNTVTNHVIRKSYQGMNLKIQSGQRLGPTLAETGYMPNWVLVMVSTGEESGDLEQMLDNSVEYLDEEINHKVEIMMALMEPSMLLVLGAVVGCVALGIYLPLFGMYEHMG
jgi:type IV pilus assembly protein PilC